MAGSRQAASLEADFLVVGSGIAGLSFALQAAAHGSVAILTKRSAQDGATAWAQGGIAAAVDDEDSFADHAKDTLISGAGLCNPKTVVVPGHGEVGDVEAAKRQIKYFEDVQAAVAKAIKDNKKREEVVQMSLPQYSEYGLKQAQPLVLGGAFDEMTKGGGAK